jgi:hypothetical protein
MQQNSLNFCAKRSVWHSEVPKQIWQNALAYCVKRSMWQEEVPKQIWKNAQAFCVKRSMWQEEVPKQIGRMHYPSSSHKLRVHKNCKLLKI